jgi:hypothetical protein
MFLKGVYMKTITKVLKKGQIQITAETYLDLVLTISELNTPLTVDMKDDLIAYAYAESKTIGADETVAFLEVEDGTYIAQLFKDEIVALYPIHDGELYVLRIVREGDLSYKAFSSQIAL